MWGGLPKASGESQHMSMPDRNPFLFTTKLAAASFLPGILKFSLDSGEGDRDLISLPFFFLRWDLPVLPKLESNS